MEANTNIKGLEVRQTAAVTYRTSRERKNAIDALRAEKGCTLRELVDAALDMTYGGLPKATVPYETYSGISNNDGET